MHVEFAAQADLWGGWRFGDLAVAVCRTVEVVGPTADVARMSVREPTIGPVEVVLEVADADEAARLRCETENGEYVSSSWGTEDIGWSAVVNGVSLVVTTQVDRS